MQAKIIREVKTGNYLVTAAKTVRIHPETLYRWLREGEAATSGPLRDFYLAVAEAKASVESRLVTSWAKTKAWQGKRDFLARRFRKHWAQEEAPQLGPIVPIQIIFQTRPPGYDPMAADPLPGAHRALDAAPPEPAPRADASSASPLKGFVEIREHEL